jgi:hypothetical protein
MVYFKLKVCLSLNILNVEITRRRCSRKIRPSKHLSKIISPRIALRITTTLKLIIIVELRQVGENLIT